MEDYPRTLLELERMFSTDADCRDYLFRLRWPDGFICPRCGNAKAWPVGEILFQCSGCDYKVSITAGTVFQNTRKPLTLWFRAIWLIVSQKNGISAVSLQQILGLKSYETAWTWLHKLRRAMVRPGRDRLVGHIEVDETYLGGLEEGVRGRKTEQKALIIVAAQKNGNGIGRIRLRHIPDASAESLHPFIVDSIEPGSLVHTDGWTGYQGLELKGYKHEVTILKTSKKKTSELLPRVHRVVALLKRWLLGTHQGAISHKHLDYYLDEYTFRFNRRNSRHRGKLFYRLIQQAVAIDPVTLNNMIDI